MLVRGDSLEKSMSHYLIEQIADAAEHRRAHGLAGDRRRGRGRPPARAARSRGPDGAETRRGRRRVLRLHRRARRAPTGWRASSRATSAASSSPARTRRARGWPLQARPLRARDERARRVRRRRRARALDQARRQRGRRGLDGGVADPRVPGDAHEPRVTRRRPAPGRPVRRPRRRAARARGRPWPSRCDARARRASLAEQGDAAARRCCCCSRARRGRSIVDRRAHRAGRPPGGADLDRRDRRRSPGARSACACAPRPPCRLAMIPADDFRRLALAQPAVHRRVMRQVAPVMTALTALEQNRERLASLGTMAAGLAHELNNPAAAARRAAAQLAEALEVDQLDARRASSRRGSSARRPSSSSRCSARRWRARRARTPLDALDAADAEDDAARAPGGPRRRRGLAARRAARRGRRRRGVARPRRRARRPRDRRGAALGRGVADRRTASRASCRSRPSG